MVRVDKYFDLYKSSLKKYIFCLSVFFVSFTGESKINKHFLFSTIINTSQPLKKPNYLQDTQSINIIL